MGFENDHAVLWHVFSHVAKLHLTLKLSGKRTDERVLYSFHESVVDALRPTLNEGIRSIVVTAPMKTTYAEDFLDHVRRHHAYLIQSKSANRATFAQLVGSADQPHKVAELVKTKEFHKLIAETTSDEVDLIVDALEKRLRSVNSDSAVLFSLKEIEDRIYDQKRTGGAGTFEPTAHARLPALSRDRKKKHENVWQSQSVKQAGTLVSGKTKTG